MDRVLLETVFDTPARPSEALRRLRALTQALDDEDLDQARRLLDELSNDLGADDPELVGSRALLTLLDVG